MIDFYMDDEVQICHEGDKDDGLYGKIIDTDDLNQFRADRFLVQFPDGSGGWYERDEIRHA